MESIDRLRDWLKGRLLLGNGWNELNEIADAIESEVKANRVDAYTKGYDEGFASADDWAAQHEDAMAEHGWVRLPVDADGEYIHVGDVVTMDLMFGGKSSPLVVDRMELSHGKDGELWCIALDTDKECWNLPSLMHHHHAPTVEDVLREFTDAVLEWAGKSGTVAEVGTWSDVAAKYAAKLRLAGDE